MLTAALVMAGGCVLLMLATLYLWRENRYQSLQIEALRHTIKHKDDYIQILLQGRPDADTVLERLRDGQF